MSDAHLLDALGHRVDLVHDGTHPVAFLRDADELPVALIPGDDDGGLGVGPLGAGPLGV